MYLEQLSILIDFIKENNKKLAFSNRLFFTEDDIFDNYYISKEEISHIVNTACQANKRIHSENISIAIEEVSSYWEVT